MKYFEHDGRRWMEGEHEGRWFALNEDGDRLVWEKTAGGFLCCMGSCNSAADTFTGESCGVLNNPKRAMAWLYESDPSVEPTAVRERRPVVLSITEPVAC